jgi:phytoene dehydrogenase-like protein
MNLVEIAKIYTDLVKAEQEIPEEEYHAKDRLNALRTKYHQVFMDKMREEGIDFSDRFDATNKAFELIKEIARF